MLADVSKIALPADGLVCAHVTREHCRSLADVRVLTTDVILERRALDGSVVAERTLVGSEARVAHFVAAERVVVTGAIRTDIATVDKKKKMTGLDLAKSQCFWGKSHNFKK